MAISAAIYGLAGLKLSETERSFFQEAEPWGFILFARNVDGPVQLKKLTDSLKDLTGRAQLPILIDQEGGRVARLRPPHWRTAPSGARFGELYERNPAAALEAVRLNSRLIGYELVQVGINVDCLPVLDVPLAGSHHVIGDRAYSTDPNEVAAIGRAAADGLLEAGVLPVIKHIPGHGRALADSHHTLPHVTASHDQLTASDFVPFKALANLPLAMTAHIIYEAIDPALPATTSPIVIERIIRREIEYDGLLMTDDLSMKALSGDFVQRTRDCLSAGCDMVLHCNGEMSEMTAIASACSALEARAADRASRAVALLEAPKPRPFDEGATVARLAELLAEDAV